MHFTESLTSFVKLFLQIYDRFSQSIWLKAGTICAQTCKTDQRCIRIYIFNQLIYVICLIKDTIFFFKLNNYKVFAEGTETVCLIVV